MDNSGVSFNRTAKSPLTTFFDFWCSLNLMLYLLSFRTQFFLYCVWGVRDWTLCASVQDNSGTWKEWDLKSESEIRWERRHKRKLERWFTLTDRSSWGWKTKGWGCKQAAASCTTMWFISLHHLSFICWPSSTQVITTSTLWHYTARNRNSGGSVARRVEYVPRVWALSGFPLLPSLSTFLPLPRSLCAVQ